MDRMIDRYRAHPQKKYISKLLEPPVKVLFAKGGRMLVCDPAEAVVTRAAELYIEGLVLLALPIAATSGKYIAMALAFGVTRRMARWILMVSM